LSVAAGALAAVASMAAPSFAGTVTFGSGANAFNMEFVTVGNPGNAADTRPQAQPQSGDNPETLGSVGYTYDLGKFEVSEDMIAKYNANFGTGNNLAITTSSRGANKPATNVTWNEAARFVNWLNASTGYQEAYKFTTPGVNADIELWDATNDPLDYDSANQFRSKRAKYVLPSYHEWHKAAYYNPNDSTWYDYANGKNTAPASVANGQLNDTAVYKPTSGSRTSPADITDAGGLSPYGLMAMNGNVSEWNESTVPNIGDYNSDVSYSRIIRDGFFNSVASFLKVSYSSGGAASQEGNQVGFRVVSLSSEVVPEPSMMVIGTLFGLGGLVAKRRRKK